MATAKKKAGRPSKALNDKKMAWTISLTIDDRKEILKATKTKSLTEAILTLKPTKP